MTLICHEYFFVHSDLIQKRYECIRSVRLGLTCLDDALRFYDFSLKDYNKLKASFYRYSFVGLFHLSITQIKKPKCKCHDTENAIVINRRYGKSNISYMKCPVCDHIFSSKQGTALYRSHVADKEYCQIITALARRYRGTCYRQDFWN